MARRRVVPERPTEPVVTSTGSVELRSDTDGVMLLIDGVESSHLDLTDPEHLVFEYMQQMMALIEHSDAAHDGLRALHLGGAGCALARALDSRWKQARQVAVEIDAELARLVREWFDLPRAPRLRIRVGDGRAEIATIAESSQDLVVRDAFTGRTVPPHLRTDAFTELVRTRLRPEGLYLANLADNPPLKDARREVATVLASFAHVVVVAEPAVLRGRRWGNVVVAASQVPVSRPGLVRALRSLPVPATAIVGADVEDFVAGATPFQDPT